MVVRPSVRALEPRLRDATLAIARRLSEHGKQAWLVGGAVRDLALGASPKDIDFATDATPDEIEACFEHTVAVGKAFGTIVVVEQGCESQVTTFRSERGYADARRPEQVVFGRDLVEDASRRDFTCNALYLDPLADQLHDPFGGMADLEARTLRTVGDARQRFAEDGLRLVRMARLAAAHSLEVDAGVFEAAKQSLDALRGVSAERRLGELKLIFERPNSARAMGLLERSGVLETLCPGQERLVARDVDAAADNGARWKALEALGRAAASEGFAIVFDPALGRRSADRGAREAADVALRALKPSRSLLEDVRGTWAAHASWWNLGASRAARIRLARDEHWPRAERVLEAWLRSRGDDDAELAQFRRWRTSLAPHELRPQPWITSDDLERSGVPRGPLWGKLLDESETRRLDGEFATRDEALAWLAGRVASLDGAL